MACNSWNFLDFSVTYNTEDSCDTLVTSEDGFLFKAHKLFLSEGSEFFRAFFNFKLQENSTELNSIKLHFDKSVLEKVLHFLYSGSICLSMDSVSQLAEAADFLLIDDLKTQCKDYILKNISLDNFASLLTKPYLLERLGIKERCIRFVSVNFNIIVLKGNSDISKLPFDIFHDLIRKNSLRVTDELYVWQAIVRWVERDRSVRLKDVPDLLSCIRWSELNGSEKSSILVHEIIKKNPFCSDVNIEQVIRKLENEYKGRFPSKLHFFSCNRALKRKAKDSSGARSTIREIYITYDDEMDMCRKIAETTEDFGFLAAAGQFIFKFDRSSNYFTAYDLVRKKWSSKSPMSKTLTEFPHFVQCKKFIFVVPQERFLSRMTRVEYYDTKADEWLKSAPIPSGNCTFRAACATVLSDRFYIVGYNTSRATEMRAYVYDIARNVWSSIRTPKQFFRCFALINFRERLYILGGIGINQAYEGSQNVAVYCPEIDEWVDFKALPFLYMCPQAVILNDNLIVYQNPICNSKIYKNYCPPCTWNETTEEWDVLNFAPFDSIDTHKFCFTDEENVFKSLSKQNKDPTTVWDTSINWAPFGIEKKRENK